MAKNIGTLISSAIRPNDSLDPIASHLVMKLKEVCIVIKSIAKKCNNSS
jgi:hypothetical protein